MSAFITPSAPILKSSPPSGPDWLHEVKFDGWRVQLHRVFPGAGKNLATIYSRNGADFTKRFPMIAEALKELPAISAILDAELVACDLQGLPDFRALMSRASNPDLCCWCFDLLELDGRDLRPLPLIERKARLVALLHKADHALRYSDHFDDGEKLLAEMGRRHMEGIVSKKKSQPYRSGKNSGWIKVKTAEWKAANKRRWETFERAK